MNLPQTSAFAKTAALLVFLFALCVQHAVGATDMAPADEYFGPFHESILGIRNRLQRYDTYSDSQMLDPDVPAGLDNVAKAIADWQQKYPRDPWLPKTYVHLIREYQRAGRLSSECAIDALNTMRAHYPDAAETIDASETIAGDR